MCKTLRTVWLAAAMALCVGCAAVPDGLQPAALPLEPAVIGRVVQTQPLAPAAPLRRDRVLDTAELSVYVLQAGDTEQRCLHQRHDLLLTVYRGRGYVTIGTRALAAQPGDVYLIPRGTPYTCVSDSSTPLVAVLVFTPPFDDADVSAVPAGARSYERTDAGD
jgi:mannose-6-phosphate isomerase-like protein (cupin superfamily)